MKNIVAIIQARMGSNRLPGKVLMDINGKPMLWQVIERVKNAKNINFIVVATTNNHEDNKIIRLANELNVKVFTGSEDDVLDRYYLTAKKFKIDTIVRITADCPLIDPKIIDKMINKYLNNKNLDYMGMGKPNLCPDGLDTELFSFKALKKAWMEAKLTSEREHVTPYIKKNKQKFNIGYAFKPKNDYSNFRWTVDEEKDLKFVTEVYKNLHNPKKLFYTKDILNLLKRKPNLLKINQGIIRNEGYLKSLKEDRLIR